MNTNHTLYTLYSMSHDRMAQIRRELQAALRAPVSYPALAGEARSLWQDPALYLTVAFAALLITLLDMAVRMQ
jgi:hypothetical protein